MNMITSKLSREMTGAPRASTLAIGLLAVASAFLQSGCEKQEPIRPSTPTTASPAEPIKESVTPSTPGATGVPAPSKPASAPTGPAEAAPDAKPTGGTVEMGAHTTGVIPSATGAAPATPPKDATPITAAPLAADDQSLVATFAGLSAPKPVTWQYRPSDPQKTMRKGEYVVPGVDGASQADITVFQFPGGGSPQDNINRWKNQVQGPDGNPAEAKIETFEADGMKITVAELAGAYRGMGSSAAVPDSILIASMIETDGDPVFVQLAGPSKTVSANREAFLAMLRGIKKTEPMK